MLTKNKEPIRYCREYWFGNSHDGQYVNGDGYHYFKMEQSGTILKAFEYYENDEGEEFVSALPDLEGCNWYQTFGFSDDELLEPVVEPYFTLIEDMSKGPLL